MYGLIIIWFLIFLPCLLFGQEKKGIKFLDVEASSIDKIILIDHYNDNYERIWGRKYEIILNSDTIKLYQTEEYYKSYQFIPDSLNFNKMHILQEKGIDSIKMNGMLAEINRENENRIKYRRRIDSMYWGTSTMLKNWKGKNYRKVITKPEIDYLFSEINIKNNGPFRYLQNEGVDSLWLSENSNRLYNLWFQENKKSKAFRQTYVKYNLENFKQFKECYMLCLLQRNMNNYPCFEVQIISNNNDTTFLKSQGQEFFQIPWNMNEQYKSYNANLAIALGKLLPNEDHFSSEKRLNPKYSDLEKEIINYIDFKSTSIDEKKWKKIAKTERKTAENTR